MDSLPRQHLFACIFKVDQGFSAVIAHMPWLYLSLAIALEVISTTFLKASNGFTRPGLTAFVLLGYAGAFYFLSLALKTIPLGIAYAIWAGIGIAAIAVIGRVVYAQKLSGPAIIGICLILAGVLILNLSTGHGEKEPSESSILK